MDFLDMKDLVKEESEASETVTYYRKSVILFFFS